MHLPSEKANGQAKEDFTAELGLMKSLGPHPYVVSLLGCCTISGEIASSKLMHECHALLWAHFMTAKVDTALKFCLNPTESY